jgi:transketolase
MADKKKKTPDVDTPDTSKKEEKKEETTFTQEKVDKIVSDRLEREQEKWQSKIKEEVAKARKEAEELAKLSNEEREQEITKQHRKELEEKERALATRENRLEAIDMFSEAKVPIHLVDYVVDTDKKVTVEKAERFLESYQESVQNTVTEKLKGTAPKDVNKSSDSSKSKEVVTKF